MAVPVSQMWTVASYVLKQRLTKTERYPLVLMLEPLFRCNLACAGCGKIQYPAQIIKKENPNFLFKNDILSVMDKKTVCWVFAGAENLINRIKPVSPDNSRYTRGLTGGRGRMPEVNTSTMVIEDRGTRFTLLNVFENEQEGTKTYILQGRCKNLVGGEFRGEKVISVQVFIYNGYDATEVVVGKKN
jgi:hypothetical protein